MDYFMGFRGMGRHMFFGLIPVPVVWNLIIILIIALIFYWLIRSSGAEDALDIAKKRYASGEIDRKNFLGMKKDIED